jgi:hypothetical protein
MEEYAIVLVEMAAGIVLGFVIWSFVSPMVTSAAVTPAA